MTITENTQTDPFTVDFVDSRSEQAKGVDYTDLVGKPHTTAEEAILNGWDVTIERDGGTVTISATDPEWVELAQAAKRESGMSYQTVNNVGVRVMYDLHADKKPTFSFAQSASCHMAEIYDDDYMRTGEYEPSFRWNNTYRKADELSMKGANSLLFSASPRKRKIEEIKAIAREIERQALVAAYETEKDSPARKSLRHSLQNLRDKEQKAVDSFRAGVAKPKDPDDSDWAFFREMEYNTGSVQASAFLVRLVDQVFDLEGIATSDGWAGQREKNPLYTLTLEAATIMVATSCMKTVIRDVARGLSRSSSTASNAQALAKAAAQAEFAGLFCPVVKDGLDGYIYADLDDDGIALFVKAADRNISI